MANVLVVVGDQYGSLAVGLLQLLWAPSRPPPPHCRYLHLGPIPGLASAKQAEQIPGLARS